VHEEIARGIDAAFGAHVTKFHSAGREDIDVRMLGSGRPFVLELVGACARLVVERSNASARVCVCCVCVCMCVCACVCVIVCGCICMGVNVFTFF